MPSMFAHILTIAIEVVFNLQAFKSRLWLHQSTQRTHLGSDPANRKNSCFLLAFENYFFNVSCCVLCCAGNTICVLHLLTYVCMHVTAGCGCANPFCTRFRPTPYGEVYGVGGAAGHGMAASFASPRTTLWAHSSARRLACLRDAFAACKRNLG